MKSLKWIILLTLLLTLVNTRGAWALASGLPSDDAYVYDQEPADPHNGEELIVDASTTSCTASDIIYMQWDLADIRSNDIHTATLTLTATYASSTGSAFLTLYETTDAWDETTLTLNNAPAVGTAIETRPAPTAVGQTVVFSGTNLLNYVTTAANGDKVVSFALRLSSGCSAYSGVYFRAKEYLSGGGPYLFLQGPNAVKHSGLRIAGLDAQWPIVGMLILGGLVITFRRANVPNFRHKNGISR
ncbi:MAG TPA: DNRLRE domain-containing protein [Anaerolineae bacterium]|nr:DNRLRE domain-containing protein [Anaerolineae bacterium]HQK13195.1 DNRLRE domain-containing protein [Anaerolineae bacterium]